MEHSAFCKDLHDFPPSICNRASFFFAGNVSSKTPITLPPLPKLPPPLPPPTGVYDSQSLASLSSLCFFLPGTLLEHVQILIQLFSVANTSRPVKLRPVLHIPPGQGRPDLPSLHESGLLKLGRANKAAKKRPQKQQPPHKPKTNMNNPSQSGGLQQSPPSSGTASVIDAKGRAKATRRGSRGKNSDARWHYTHYTPQENGTANQSIWITYK